MSSHLNGLAIDAESGQLVAARVRPILGLGDQDLPKLRPFQQPRIAFDRQLAEMMLAARATGNPSLRVIVTMIIEYNFPDRRSVIAPEFTWELEDNARGLPRVASFLRFWQECLPSPIRTAWLSGKPTPAHSTSLRHALSLYNLGTPAYVN
jgi:uncharacterized protein Usg